MIMHIYGMLVLASLARSVLWRVTAMVLSPPNYWSLWWGKAATI